MDQMTSILYQLLNQNDIALVSRVHADILVQSDAYYIKDVGSSNGTYINDRQLYKGDRHHLKVGDRIYLGKKNLVTFLFQLSSVESREMMNDEL